MFVFVLLLNVCNVKDNRDVSALESKHGISRKIINRSYTQTNKCEMIQIYILTSLIPEKMGSPVCISTKIHPKLQISIILV